MDANKMNDDKAKLTKDLDKFKIDIKGAIIAREPVYGSDLDIDKAPKFEELPNTNDKLNDLRFIKTHELKANNALLASEEGRMATSNNYIPYLNKVGIDIIIEAKLIDILSSKNYAELLGKIGGDIFKTGKHNPEIRVNGFGHQVQGLNIGDTIDISNQVAGAVSIKGSVAGGYDFEAIKDFYKKRNPVAFQSIVRSGSRVMNIKEVGLNNDLDKLDEVITFTFKGLMDAFNIEGIYFNRTLLKDMDGLKGDKASDFNIEG